MRTLRPAGKLEQLTHAMSRYHWNIVGLCEMRWKNFSEMSADDGHKVNFSGQEGKHEYGVGFLVHTDVVGAVLGCQPVSSRLISIRLREAQVESFDKTGTRYKMEISAEKTKLMTNSANVGHCNKLQNLGAVVSDDGSTPEVLSRIAQATAALTKLKPIWRDNNLSLGSKVKLMRSLVISIFSVCL